MFSSSDLFRSVIERLFYFLRGAFFFFLTEKPKVPIFFPSSKYVPCA